MITKISAYIMPFVILIIVGYGMYKKSDNYDNFVNGAEDGMRTVVSIAPTLIGRLPIINITYSNIITNRNLQILCKLFRYNNTVIIKL